MKISEVTDWLEREYPASYAEEWDNVGLLAGDDREEVRKVFLALDLTDPQALDAYSAELRVARPSVELLVHAAGFGKMGDYRAIALEDATRMIDLNCKAAVSITERTLWRMHRGSRILEICSTAAFQPLPIKFL